MAQLLLPPAGVTQINVEDFGCVPDGRVLERVSIDANSAVLHAPEGGLRPVDVGKNIAIPGAADLDATIALARPREVQNATLTLDDPTRLTGTVANPVDHKVDTQGFVARVHEGWSITVAGAGPGGATLLTTIAKVLDSKTIRLADAASKAVAAADNVNVILNDPKVVELSNYARRTVADVQVDLGGRSIADARMTIGARGLRSETARFSSLDVGKPVKIKAAGLFITTIHSVDSPTQATLTAPAPRAVATLDEVQADVWKTDSRPGFADLLTKLATRDTESAEIRFGAGVYDFKRDKAAGERGAIMLHGHRNLTLRGSGQGVTVIRLMPGQNVQGAETHVVETADCENVTLRDLSLHGAYLTLATAHEQMHGIHLFSGSEDVNVQQVTVFQSAGDAVRFLGSPDKKVSRVWVDGCRLIQNKRSGVSFQRSVELIWVRNCHIDMSAPGSDQCVEFEPSVFAADPVAPTDVIIESNVLVHGRGNPTSTAVGISGVSGPDPARRVKFVNNVVLGGQIFCTDVAELTIQGNVVRFPDSERIPGDLVSIDRGGDSVLITDNVLINEHPGTRTVINVSEANGRQVSRARIAGNLCITRAGGGIQVVASDDVAVEGNMLVATGAGDLGIRVASEPSAVNHVSVRGNDITVKDQGSWKTGIIFVARQPIHHVSAVGNSIAGAAQGVAFAGTGFTETPVCALNRIEGDVASPLVGLTSLPQKAMVVGGAASRGGSTAGTGAGRFLVGVGDPNVPRGNPPSAVPGNVGDIYQRIDANAQAALYVKQSGDGTTTGWVPK
jgi:hypothetical protein